jgi:hypothetical protein
MSAKNQPRAVPSLKRFILPSRLSTSVSATSGSKPNDNSALLEELKELRAELKLLKREAALLREKGQPKQASEITKEVKTLESSLGKFLLDVAEEIPVLGSVVKWFR